MGIRPYTLLGSSHVEEIEHQARTILESWRLAWCEERISIRVDGVQPLDRSLGNPKGDLLTHVGGSQPDCWGVLQTDSFFLDRFADLLFFGEGVPPPMTIARNSVKHDIAQDALNDLIRRLLEAGGCDGDIVPTAIEAFPESLTRPGNGSIGIAVTMLKLKFTMYLSEKVVVKYLEQLQRSIPLKKVIMTPIIDALGRQKLTVAANLGTTEVSLDELMSLARGDVLTLDQHIGDLFDVEVKGSCRLCQAQLGKQDNCKAISLTVNGTHPETESNPR